MTASAGDQSPGVSMRLASMEQESARIESQIDGTRAAIGGCQQNLRACEKRYRLICVATITLLALHRVRGFVDRWLGARWVGVVLTGMSFGGILALLTHSGTIGMVGTVCGVIVCVPIFVLPSDRVNRAYQSELSQRALVGQEMIAALRAEIALHETNRVRLNEEYLTVLRCVAELRQSATYRREALLRLNWKALRDREFEQFLADVFAEIGYQVEQTGKSGDQGADLVVIKGGIRLVIQAKGYYNSVSNSAVQEAHAAKDYYGCDLAAVVTNSRFTPSAIELAERIGCMLIDEERLPDLVMGQIELRGAKGGANVSGKAPG